MKKIWLAIGLLVALTAAAPVAPPESTASPAEARLHKLEVAEAQRAGVAANAAEQRDIDDLGAQKEMARAADQMANWTVAQVGVGLLGALFVGFSILQSNRALQASTKAVDQNAALMSMTQKHAELQLMAYPEVTSYELKKVSGDTWELSLTLSNKGQTPALNVDIMAHAEMRDGVNNDIQWQELPEAGRLLKMSRLVPNGELKPRTRLQLNADRIAELAAGATSIWYRADIVYEDVFHKRFRMRFSALVHGENGANGYLCRHANDVVELPNG